MGRMGHSQSTGSGVCDFTSPIQSLLKQRGLKISTSTVQAIVKDIDKAAPWFAVSGDLTLNCWEKLGRDLESAKENDQLGRGTLPLWKLVHSCLKEGRNIEVIKQGRRVLSEHQDSLSEAESRGEENARKIKREKKKASQKEEKEREKENPPKETKKDKNKKKPPAPLYPVLEEFASLKITDSEEEDELTEQEEEDLEEAAASYEEERYDPPLRGRRAKLGTGPMAPSAPYSQLAPPPYCPPQNNCHFIGGRTWSRLAAAFPVFQDPQTNNRYHEPIPYKQLKDLVEASKTYGATASYTLTLLSRLANQAMTPSDWWEVARACLSTGQYLDYRSIVNDAAHGQARVNAQNQQPAWNADMLLGQGQWAANQTAYPLQVYTQINEIFQKAWKTLPNKGEVSGNLTKIIQGPNEPFSDFVARMLEAAGKIFGDVEQGMPLVQQLVYEQATKDCRRAITPWKGKGLEAWLKACREIGGPLTNAGLAAAVVAATRRQGNNAGGV